MDEPLASFGETGPLTAILLADSLLEQTWMAAAPETWFAAPFVVMLTWAFAASTRQGRASGQTIERLSTVIRSRRGAGAAVAMALRELRTLSDAREVLIVVDGLASPPLLFADATGQSPDHTAAARMVATGERSTYFFGTPSGADAPDGIVTFETPAAIVPAAFREAHEFDHLVGFAFRSGQWDGRLFLLDPAFARANGRALRAFEELLRHLLPAIARVCHLHAERRRAEERERARLGRELHDGVVQELTCLDMELELIGVAAAPHAGICERIRRVQERLRAELSGLRRVLQDARYRDVDASQLPAVLEAMVERFGRDTSVHADYVSHVSEVRLSPHVCGEIARIVQEALANVRRHSGARHVVVTFSCDNADWKLSIQDDGRGFSTGRRTRLTAGPPTALPPSVIYERVHSLGGTVRVVAPGSSGARIEISAPQRDVWNRMT